MKKTSNIHTWLVALLLVLGAAPALAQTQPADASADALIQRALETLRQIDEDRPESAWQSASPVLKTRFPMAELAATFRKSRATVGTVSQRTWASVSRVRYVDPSVQPDIPAGLYANIDFSTQLTDGRTVFEMVTFRQEADGVWRLMGYVPRQRQ